jgi:hypothetical protein
MIRTTVPESAFAADATTTEPATRAAAATDAMSSFFIRSSFLKQAIGCEDTCKPWLNLKVSSTHAGRSKARIGQDPLKMLQGAGKPVRQAGTFVPAWPFRFVDGRRRLFKRRQNGTIVPIEGP